MLIFGFRRTSLAEIQLSAPSELYESDVVYPGFSTKTY